jgi:hypothetical protein
MTDRSAAAKDTDATAGLGGHTYNPDTHFLQPKITGYRQLSPDQVEVINEAKRIGQLAGNLCDSLVHDKNIDQRWLAIAKTDLQKGFMALVRSVAQPDSF